MCTTSSLATAREIIWRKVPQNRILFAALGTSGEAARMGRQLHLEYAGAISLCRIAATAANPSLKTPRTVSDSSKS